MNRLLQLSLCALVLSGCQSAGSGNQPEGIAAYAGDPRLGERTDRICFASGIDSFSMNRDRSLVLRRGMDEFLVEVYGPCPELAYAQTIAIGSATGCLSRGDRLIVSSSLQGAGGAGGSGIGPDRCVIREIHAWNSRADKPEADGPEADGREADGREADGPEENSPPG